MSMLSNTEESLTAADFGKYEIPGDKIRVNDEPYETLSMVKSNKMLKFLKANLTKSPKNILVLNML